MNRRAFTFLEILFTVVIISVGLIAIMNWVPVAIQTKIKTERRTIAIFLAQKNIEEAKRILLSNFDSVVTWTVNAGFDCTGDVITENPNLKTIRVSVWHIENPSDITTFSTRVARR
jgi:type II secretory pathway pseudopilin PulG